MIRQVCVYMHVRVSAFLERHAGILLFIFGVMLLNSGVTQLSHAAEGEGIFERAACNILEEVLADWFGAMLTVITGALAIIASVAGSFKGAWALLFVSVGCYIAPSIIAVLFPDLSCAGSQE